MIQEELTARSLVAMALARDVHKHVPTAMSIQRQAHQALRERLRSQYIKQHIPADFPTEADMQSYYDRDPSLFRIPQRMQVWQIFFPVSDAAQEPQVLATAEDVLARIFDNTLSFQEAATTYSRHLLSRYRGGYVGLIDLTDIDAALRPTLLELPPGQPGGPVRGSEGYHVVQRGKLYPEMQLDFESARQLIRQRMLNERREALQQELTSTAAQDYPYSIKGETVMQWWNDMRAEAGL